MSTKWTEKDVDIAFEQAMGGDNKKALLPNLAGKIKELATRNKQIRRSK